MGRFLEEKQDSILVGRLLMLNRYRLFKYVFFVIIIICSGKLYADPPSKADKLRDDSFVGLIGADFEFSALRGNGDWSKLVPTTYPGGNLYVGARFFDYFGVIFGYDFTNRRSKTHTFQVGESFLDFPNDIAGLMINNSMRLEEWYLDIMGYIPFWNCFDFIATIGYGSMRVKLTDTLELPAAAGAPLLITTSQFTGLARAGFGIQYMVTNMVGIRSMLRWKQTSKIKANTIGGFPLPSGQNRPFKDAFTFGLGVFFAI